MTDHGEGLAYVSEAETCRDQVDPVAAGYTPPERRLLDRLRVLATIQLAVRNEQMTPMSKTANLHVCLRGSLS